MQRHDRARCKPKCDVIADLRLWHGQRSQRLDGALHCTGVTVPLGGCVFEDSGQIKSMAAYCKRDQLPADAPDEAAGGFAGGPAF